MNVSNDSHINSTYNNSVVEAHNLHSTDDSYKQKLQESIRGKYAIVLVGHSGNGYQGDRDELCVNIRNNL